jgi:hypothetical protein
MITNSAPVTHPETAWLAASVLLWLGLAAALGLALVLRGTALRSFTALFQRNGSRNTPHGELTWLPPIASAGQLVAIGGLASALVVGGLTLLAPLFVAVVLAAPLVTLVIWLALRLMEARYVSALDAELPAAVARLAAALRTGGSYPLALERVTNDLTASSLRAEWQFILERLAAPDARGVVGPAQVAGVLARQTPSPRHAALLEHLEVALSQTHDVLVLRVEAAAEALFAAERRRSAAATELAHMRYSGVAIGLAGLSMFVYLALTQTERMTRAYQGPLGLMVGVAVAIALAAPFVAGVLLARTDDMEY